MIYIIVDEDYRFVDVKRTKKEAELLIEDINEGLDFIGCKNEYSILEKNI